MLQKFLDIARKEIGYKEKGTNNTKYGAWYGINPGAWCAMFISWIAYKCGILKTKIPKYSGCGSGYNWFKKRGLLTNFPKPGYIGFLTSKKGTSSHTFIVEKVDGINITTIEGNLDNSVKRNSRKTTDKNILGFGIVEFEDTTQKSIIKYVDNVDYEGLNVRDSKTNKILDTIPIGTKVSIVKIIKDKAYLNDNKYVYAKYLSDKMPKLKEVTGADSEGLNVRVKRNTNNKPIACLKNSTKVKVYAEKDGWSKVSHDSEAWVVSKYLK